MDARELVQTIADKVQARASVKTIVGDPIRAEGKTIIPLASVSYGFGAGAGYGGSGDGADIEASGEDEVSEHNGAVGGGGGGGVRVSPVGVLEITPEQTRFIHIGFRRRILAALALGVGAGFLAGRFFGR